MTVRLILSAGLLAMLPGVAHAFCYYHGKFNVVTSIGQEFRDARWVVRARVLSAKYVTTDDDSWVSYRLKVVRTLKGRMPATFTFFTTYDSGGFYMDNGMQSADRSEDYLLFLVPFPRNSDHPKETRGAYWVNYNCGQSQPWPRLKPGQVRLLEQLATRR